MIRSSGTRKVRPYGHRYAVEVSTVDGRLRRFTLGDLTVHEAMRRCARQVEASGLTVRNVTGTRLTRKHGRGRKTLGTPAPPIDWDAIAHGRHGLHAPD